MKGAKSEAVFSKTQLVKSLRFKKHTDLLKKITFFLISFLKEKSPLNGWGILGHSKIERAC